MPVFAWYRRLTCDSPVVNVGPVIDDLPLGARSGKVKLQRIPDVWLHAGVPLAIVALYLPLAGSYGLWDPRESHDAEVAGPAY